MRCGLAIGLGIRGGFRIKQIHLRSPESLHSHMVRFPKIRSNFLAVPRIRTTVFGVYSGILYFGKLPCSYTVNTLSLKQSYCMETLGPGVYTISRHGFLAQVGLMRHVANLTLNAVFLHGHFGSFIKQAATCRVLRVAH